MEELRCRECTCPKCGSHDITMIYELEKIHNGGNKWCMSCGKIFDELSIKEKIVIELSKEYG
jgi:transcription elongation factor Elf1